MFTALLWISFAFSVYSAYAVQGQRPPGQKPTGLDEYQVPSAEEGRPLTKHWGTPLVKSPQIIAYGNFEARPIKEKAGK